jgi:hypothetical protein
VDDFWPFADPPDTDVITLHRILSGGTPLVLVTHDADDGCWQFLDGEHLFESDAAIVSLGEMLQFDPSIIDLATLPTGWHAHRLSPDAPWHFTEGDAPPA